MLTAAARCEAQLPVMLRLNMWATDALAASFVPKDSIAIGISEVVVVNACYCRRACRLRSVGINEAERKI